MIAIRSRVPLMTMVLSLAFGACAGPGGVAEIGIAPAPTLASLSTDGAYQVGMYTDLPDVPEFGDATIYYPIDAPGRVGGVAISPGYTERQSHIEWWGPRLASHGFIVLTLDTNTPQDRPELRADALIAAVELMRSEDTRDGSPIRGRVDARKMAVMGHSMGGGGALIAADRMGDDLRASIPYTPWQPEGNFSRTTAPTLLIAGSADRIAGVGDHAWPHFQSLPTSLPRVYMEFDEGDHFIADTTRGADLPTIGRYAIAWLKLYVDGDERYRDFIFGDARTGDEGKFSRYVPFP